MNISIGMKLQMGSWGGGNQFGHALAEYLIHRGVDVSFDLKQPNLDLILLTEPRSELKISAYSDHDIISYLLLKNWKTLVIHRINECDERKGTKGVNQRLILANRCADHTIFVSKWLMELFANQGLSTDWASVIRNGSDRRIFHSGGYQKWNYETPLKLITHHWSGHWLKGFDIYERLDQLLANPEYRERFSFTYIGNLPKGFRFHNSIYLEPRSGSMLADSLRENHVYLTASRNEPGSHHQNEGGCCGLPILFIESGCLAEYCDGYGIQFRPENFEEKLHEIAITYDTWIGKMKEFPNTADHMCEQYYQKIVEMLDMRAEFLEIRRTKPHTTALLKSFLFSLSPRTYTKRIYQWLNKRIG